MMRKTVSLELQNVVKNKTGVGWYVYNIAKQLKQDNKNNYIGEVFNFCGRNDITGLKELNIRIKENTWFPYRLLLKIRNNKLLNYNKLIGTESDIYTFFRFECPSNIRGKVVVVMHDMIPLLYPDVCTEYVSKARYLASIDRADAIVAVSESTKRDIINIYGVDASKITIISPGIDLADYRRDYSAEELERIRGKYHLPSQFLLFLGTIEPRKGIDKLIQAFDIIKAKSGYQQLKLVIAGGKGWKYDKIFELFENSRFKDDIVFTGYLDESDKIQIYKLAAAFVFPTLYEGFGMPVLEAMAAGTPTITSNNSSLPEVAGEGAVLLDRESTEELCDAIEKVLTDRMFRHDLIAEGLKQSEQYTWAGSARKFEELFDRI